MLKNASRQASINGKRTPHRVAPARRTPSRSGSRSSQVPFAPETEVSVHTDWTLDYRAKDLLPAEARYARAEITGPGGTTYTNPFGISSQP
jgi:hypothetical protein